MSQQYKEWPLLLKDMEAKHGKITDTLENSIQASMKGLDKLITDYPSYWKYIGLPNVSSTDVAKRLKQAILNSKRKMYHGDIDTMLGIKNKEEQINHLLSSRSDMLDFVDCEKKTVKDASDDEWKQRCFARWNWTNRFNMIHPECMGKKIDAAWLARYSDDVISYENVLEVENFEDPAEEYNKIFNVSEIERHKPQTSNSYDEQFNWMNLYIKLDFEEAVRYLGLSANFKNLYKKCEILSKYLTSVTLYIIKADNLKSGYYYLTALLTKLTSIQNLNLKPCLLADTLVGVKATKALKKGMTNFIEKGGSIKTLCFRNLVFVHDMECEESMMKFLECVPDLIALRLYKTQLLHYRSSKLISNFLTQHHEIVEIVLSNSIWDANCGKELADGLMRSKKLQVICIENNSIFVTNSLASIVYNLAFSPKLEYLDISNNTCAEMGKLVENLGKLLAISGSLEALNLSNIVGLMQSLKADFFKSLGENITLKALNLNSTGVAVGSATLSSVNLLGNSVAFNGRNKGKLSELHLSGCLSIYSQNFFESMSISNKDYEQMYGDRVKASKMGGEDLTKKFTNSLQVLDLSKNSITGDNFNLDAYKKKQNIKKPFIAKLFTECPNLVELSLRDCTISANLLDLALVQIEEGLKSGKKDFCNWTVLNLRHNHIAKESIDTLGSILSKLNKLKTLDLSKCSLGVAGGHLMKKHFEDCKELQYLNLFNNLLDVDGLRSISKVLATNTSLKYIDFGYNRLRDEGLKNIQECLSKNPKSSLQALSLRYNFLNNDSIKNFLDSLPTSTSLIRALMIKRNNLTSDSFAEIQKKAIAVDSRFYCDIFDKIQITHEDKLARTICVYPTNNMEEKALTNWFENIKKTGVIVNVRQRIGQNYPNRLANRKIAFIEFASETAVQKSLMIGKKKRTLNSVKLNIYRAGTSTYFYSKNCAAKDSKTNYAANNKASTVRKKITRGGRR